MSSFYDDASLVVIPSGYKTSKIYAEKPTSGAGDLTFTRASGATRVGPNGLIEKVRTNLVLQSQNFENASWTKDGATVTANATSAPDGTTTADKILETATTAVHNVYQVPSISSSIYSISFFLKKAERYKAAIADRNTGGYVAVNLNTGAIIESLLFSGKIESFASDWYRVTITSASAVSVLNPQVFILPDSYTTGVPALITYAGSATSGIFVWGAQLETGDIATNYIPTTTAAVSVGPVSNVPRLDYLGSSCPRLLLEPQRTNLVTFSESFDNAGWAKSACSITANNVVSPDGYTNADLVTSSGAAGYVYPGNTNIFGSAGGATYAYSVYAKAGTASTITILVGAAATYTGVFNLSAGTATTSTANTTVSIVSAGNGWYRCVIICASVSNQVYSELQIGRVANGLTFYLYGAQLEAGAYATSYIPTLGASVTRVADGNLDFSAVVNNASFTFFFEGSYSFADSNFFDARVLTAGGNYLGFYNGFVAIYNVGSGTTVFGSSLAANTNHKVLFKYDGANAKFYRNGTLLLSVAATSVGTFVDGLIYNADQEGLKIKQFLYFPTALTDAQCVELTTL